MIRTLVKLTPEDYPILSDLYDLMEEEYRHYDAKERTVYRRIIAGNLFRTSLHV